MYVDQSWDLALQNSRHDRRKAQELSSDQICGKMVLQETQLIRKVP